MLSRIRKAWTYSKIRGVELKISAKEFLANSRFKKSAIRAYYENNMLLTAHRIEKGLGLRNTEPGHSKDVTMQLIELLFGYIGRGYEIEAYAFRESFAVVEAYVKYQKSFGEENWSKMSDINRKFTVLCDSLGDDFICSNHELIAAGSRQYTYDQLMEGTQFDFDHFIKTRHSMRMYQKKVVHQDLIARSIEIANKAPSACNRQPQMVYFANKPDIVEMIDSLITGSSGFKNQTPNYLILTTDRARFLKDEQYQWYINGGIYLAYLTLALHSLGIGSCIMQWKAFYKTENQLKALTGISKHQAIIAIIGCGFYAEEGSSCICAQRKAIDETLKVL